MSILKEILNTADAGVARLRNKAGRIIAGSHWEPDVRSVPEVKGWVRAFCRERGKIVPGSHREGHNTFTNTGREYLALLSSLQTGPTTAYRADSIAYIGVGIGAQLEEATVTGLVNPVPYTGTTFLAAVDTPPTFPLSPSRIIAEYHKVFDIGDISLGSDPVVITELGLYTNGDQATFAAGGRDLTLANAKAQSPIAYKSIEGTPKYNDMQYEVFWEIRY